ncbi:hypothetical protein D9758_006005 [Tetrapyrgos nigripes]|uniref:Uncharacterized protein n=1 Tax=Tetrapyrgos nigripes TaxID=182062 RepID=A0A8H5G069_9AGAR|nr:hypothetical protein D9758_006005 [Tetrapyrgos nigripes]
MSATGAATVLPYSPIGSPSVDALGALCHTFYSNLFQGNESGALSLANLTEWHVIQSPTLPYNASVFSGAAGALSVADQQNALLTTSNLTIRIFTLGESHCIANGVDKQSTLVNNSYGTFEFEFLEHSYWENGLMMSAKPYFYNIYPLMRNQMLDRGADEYVAWKDADSKAREAAIAEFDSTRPNYDPHTL